MDPLSQATLGAAAAQVVARPKRFVAATLTGAIGGFLPDADVLIRSSTDPLLSLEYHRHFTHSLAFIPIGGAIAAFCCARLSRGRVGFKELYLPATLGWATHGLLDSCTSYGTYLYWPFSNERVAWHVISIVDPLFTLPLLFGVVWAMRKRAARITRAFVVLALAYMGFGVFQLHRAESVYAGVIAERGHAASGVEVKPSLGNNILLYWFSVNRTLGMKNIVVEVTGQAVARRSMFGERLALAAWRSSARRSLASASFLSLLAQMASCLSARRSAGAM